MAATKNLCAQIDLALHTKVAYTVFRTVPRYPAPIMAERMISPIFGRLSWRCCEQRGSPPWSPPVFGRMTTVSRRICWPRQKSSRDGE